MKEKKESIKITKHTTFKLAHYQNVQALVLALTQSGYFVRTTQNDGTLYEIEVYTHY